MAAYHGAPSAQTELRPLMASGGMFLEEAGETSGVDLGEVGEPSRRRESLAEPAGGPGMAGRVCGTFCRTGRARRSSKFRSGRLPRALERRQRVGELLLQVAVEGLLLVERVQREE